MRKQQNTSQTIIQSVLQPGEQPLWWDRPRWRHAKIHWLAEGMSALLTAALLALFGGIVLYIIDKQLWSILVKSLFGNIPLMCIAFVGIVLLANSKPWLRSFFALRKAVPCRKYTLYAVTDRRAVIIITAPASPSAVIEYLPYDIGPLELQTRRDGSGSLAFSPPRQVTISRYKDIASFPGRFWGIAHVEQVAELFRALASDFVHRFEDAFEQSGDIRDEVQTILPRAHESSHHLER